MTEVVTKKPHTVTRRVTVRRLAVYLDNWAIVALAKDRGESSPYCSDIPNVYVSTTVSPDGVGADLTANNVTRNLLEATATM